MRQFVGFQKLDHTESFLAMRKGRSLELAIIRRIST